MPTAMPTRMLIRLRKLTRRSHVSGGPCRGCPPSNCSSCPPDCSSCPPVLIALRTRPRALPVRPLTVAVRLYRAEGAHWTLRGRDRRCRPHPPAAPARPRPRRPARRRQRGLCRPGGRLDGVGLLCLPAVLGCPVQFHGQEQAALFTPSSPWAGASRNRRLAPCGSASARPRSRSSAAGNRCRPPGCWS